MTYPRAVSTIADIRPHGITPGLWVVQLYANLRPVGRYEFTCREAADDFAWQRFLDSSRAGHKAMVRSMPHPASE